MTVQHAHTYTPSLIPTKYAYNGTKITFKTNFILMVSPTVDDNDVVWDTQQNDNANSF